MPIKKILIVQTAFIGDVILVTPLIRETKKLFPDAEVSVLVQKSNISILKYNPWIEKVIGMEKSKFDLFNFFKTLSTLRKVKFDLAITPHRSLRTLLLLYLSGIKRRHGFNQDNKKVLLTDKFKHPKGVHKAEKNLELLSPFTKGRLDWHSELFYSDEELVKAKDVLNPERNIAIAPGSVWNTKRWPEEYFVSLCSKLSDDGWNLIFIGSNGEKELSERIIKNAGIEATNSCGQFSITGSAALLSLCDGLICNDSGALHIGNAVKTPVFAFFGPTVKRYGYYPFGANDILFEVDLDCRPCGMHGHNKCPLGHHNCMKEIKPEDAFERIITKLNSL